jgi:hypothetical protein
MNLGWRRRADPDRVGYLLDIERGYWEKEPDDDTPRDQVSKRVQRVVPFVEDTRNCLILRPEAPLDPALMASLEAAVKIAIQVEFQLEDRELGSEPLPTSSDRRQLLLYESSEGGAGVLRRLVEEPDALARVARRALAICHFDPDTGADLGHAPGARERCEAACYDCLRSYYNQRDHAHLDRHAIAPLLRAVGRRPGADLAARPRTPGPPRRPRAAVPVRSRAPLARPGADARPAPARRRAAVPRRSAHPPRLPVPPRRCRDLHRWPAPRSARPGGRGS